MTEDELKAIESLVNAATPGLWVLGNEPGDTGYLVHTNKYRGVDVRASEATEYRPSADAVFIAAAKQDIPALLAEVRRLQTERDVFEGALKHITSADCWNRQLTAKDALAAVRASREPAK